MREMEEKRGRKYLNSLFLVSLVVADGDCCDIFL